MIYDYDILYSKKPWPMKKADDLPAAKDGY